MDEAMKTEVRIRTYDDAKAKPLGEVDLEDRFLDKVMALVRSWGVRSDVSEDGSPIDLFGSFVLDETGAYFELVIAGDEH